MKRPKRNIDKSVKQSNTRRNYDTELFKWSFKDCFYEHQSWGTLGACDLIVEIIYKLESYETQIWTDLKNASGGKRDKGGSKYVRQGVFYILWYDPNHQIFPCSI